MLVGAIAFSEQPNDAVPIVCLTSCGAPAELHLAVAISQEAATIFVRGQEVPTISTLVLCMGERCPHTRLELVDLTTCEASLMKYMPLIRAAGWRNVMLGTPRCGGHQVITQAGTTDAALRLVEDVRWAFAPRELALHADESIGPHGCLRKQAPTGPVAVSETAAG
jgi:hypothetical protein